MDRGKKINDFQFKQFRICQQRSAMKVGTDGILLGAWANMGSALKILDVGTGTGLIALMAAQRTNAEITGIDIQKEAVYEAAANVSKSPWSERIIMKHLSLQDFMLNCNESFDLIISNPPFFTTGIKPESQDRLNARHHDMLPFATIIEGADKLLSKKGLLALILPFSLLTGICNEAEKKQLHLIRLTEVKPTTAQVPNRCLMEFSREYLPLQRNILEIYKEEGKDYTGNFKKLTADFYLNF